jgi:pyruvate dehydrogenase E2 component (dihydrolipoamide acetyltransferase)
VEETMQKLNVPALGKSAAGTVRRWRKNAGDIVQRGDVLVEIEGDEGLVEIEAPLSGKIQQVIATAGKSVAPGAALAVLTDGQGESTNVASPASSPANKNGDKMTTAAPVGKVIPVLMPKAGQSMEEGTIVKWRVEVGAKINKGDIIFEVETDKATMEVEATDAGRLARIVLPEGGTLKVLEPVAFLADNDADIDAFMASSGAGTPAPVQTSQAPTSAAPVAEVVQSQPARMTESGRVKASPAARKIAAERGVDLASIGAGSGPSGRILSTDVPTSAPKSAPAPVAAPTFAPASGEGITRRKMSQMRKAIARNLSASKQTIPHFYTKLTVDAGPVIDFYQSEKPKYPCSLNDVVVLCCSRVIAEFPAFRSRIEGDELVTLPTSNIGVAVGMDEGLVVPVLIGAEKMSLKQIGEETRRLAANAKSGKIEGMGQGVFTITNLGMFGVEEFSAIINPPEAAILSVGAAREEVIVSGGTFRAGKVMTVVLSADHRIIDGTLAAKFMARLKKVFEYPGQLL